MNAQRHPPPITIAACDYNRLLFTVSIQQEHNGQASDFLLEELRRAKICHPSELPGDVVSTNCRVIFRIDDEPKSRAFLLVHPEDLVWPGREISVTTPLGAALLGLCVGDRMSFAEHDGLVHEVFVEGIGLRFLDGDTAITRTPGNIWWV